MKVVDFGKIWIFGGWCFLLDDNERILLVVGKEKYILFDVFVVGFGELMVDVCGFMMKIFMVVEIWFGGCYILVFILEEEGIIFFFY